MLRKPVVLITGASGEIGHGLIERLAVKNDRAIISLDLHPLAPELSGLVERQVVGSILDGQLLDRLLAEYEIDLVFHLAALLSTRCEFAPTAAHAVNVEGTMAMQALLVGTALNESQREALAGLDRDGYVSAGFDHLHEFNQASTSDPVNDYIGDLDQIGVTGTTVTTLDLPTSVYQFAGAVDPPVNTAAPVASGDAVVGETVSVTTGSWTNSPTSYAYQWQRRPA